MSIQAFFAGAYTIGKSARSFFSHILFYIHSKKGLDLSHKEDIPGPGQYDVSFNIKNNGSEWKYLFKITKK